jgi:pSer/pThr/pTyr-binding forkhead associated (FHA) protein
MSTQTLIRPAGSATAEGVTERFDPTACLDERVRHQASVAEPIEPGRYIEIQGHDRTLHIPLGTEAMHIGRGISAELHLDENSVSRRHAIVVPRPTGARILDDRSSNGTFVNGRRVQQSELRNGDVIVLGRAVLRYVELAAPA